MLRYEELSLNAWPALKTILFRGCLLRLSNGYTKRANSANPLYSGDEDLEVVIDYAESLYGGHCLPAVFKLVGMPRYCRLDELLAVREYELVDRTHVMTLELQVLHGDAGKVVKVESAISRQWFDSYAACNQLKAEHYETAWNIL